MDSQGKVEVRRWPSVELCTVFKCYVKENVPIQKINKELPRDKKRVRTD